MAVANRMSKKEQANKVFKPSPKETNKAKLSNFFPKDSIFNKTKSYRMKGRDEVQTLDAEWRNIALNGKKIVLIKDNAVSKADLKQFSASKGAKAYYLEERKAKAPTAADKKAAEAAAKEAAEAKEAEEKAAAEEADNDSDVE